MTEEAPQPAPEPLPRSERKETFLARYTRRSKMKATTLLLSFLLIALWGQLAPHHKHSTKQPLAQQTETSQEATEQDLEEQAGLPAPAPTYIADEDEAIAMKENEKEDHSERMVLAPDTGLIENTNNLSLPKKGLDGRQPWIIYSRPFNTLDHRPRVSIVVVDMGLSTITTAKAVGRLPSPVTFAFDTQSNTIKEWLDRARQDGHEALLSLPMEPLDYPHSDPGPKTQLINLPDNDNKARLLQALSQASGYIGVTTLSGTRFVADTTGRLDLFLNEIGARGLMVLDAPIIPHSQMSERAKEKKIPYAVAERLIDSDPSPDAIDTALRQLEQHAYQKGSAIGIIRPFPVSVDRVAMWATKLQRHGIVLAPLSAVVEK